MRFEWHVMHLYPVTRITSINKKFYVGHFDLTFWRSRTQSTNLVQPKMESAYPNYVNTRVYLLVLNMPLNSYRRLFSEYQSSLIVIYLRITRGFRSFAKQYITQAYGLRDIFLRITTQTSGYSTIYHTWELVIS